MSHTRNSVPRQCTPPRAYIPDVGQTWQCPTCAETFECVEREGMAFWVRADELEAQRAAEEEERLTTVNIPTRIDTVQAPQGVPTPLMLDLGSDTAIVLQPKPDSHDGELALNIVVAGGLPIEVVAWMLGQAAETLVNGIRNSPIIRPGS